MKTIKKKVWVLTRRENIVCWANCKNLGVAIMTFKFSGRNSDGAKKGDIVLPAILTYRLPKKKNKKSK